MPNIKYTTGKNELENWLIEESNFNPKYLNKYESIFSQGNGYLSIRNALEEKYVNEHRNTFISGVFDEVENEVSEIVNLPDFTSMNIIIDGERFTLLQGSIDSYSRIMNLRNGETIRKIQWTSPNNKQFELIFKRFVSLDNLHLICQETTIKLINEDAKLRIESGINAQTTNRGVQHIKRPEQEITDDIIMNMYNTTTSNVSILYKMTQSVKKNDQTIPSEDFIRNRQTKQFFECDISSGDVVIIDRKNFAYSSRDFDSNSKYEQNRLSDKCIKSYLDKDYHTLLLASEEKWNDFWKFNDIKIDSENSFDQLSIRFALYHLNIMTNKSDPRVGIGAKGLTGEEYKGHSFWDTEIFIMPYFTLSNPKVSKNLLKYRYSLLPKAKEKAKNFGYLGAMFPWESSWPSDGEVTERFIGIDRETGKPMEVLTSELEIHIIADIIYALHQYYTATNDVDFMEKYGYEMIFETTIFWMSRVHYNNETDEFDVLNVIGPDEYKEEVDNNAYTNYLIWANLKWSVELYSQALKNGDDDVLTIAKNTKFSLLFYQIKKVLEKIHLPSPDKHSSLIKQNATYLELQEIDLSKYYNLKKGSIHKDYSMNELKKIKVSKQADLTALFYLMPNLFNKEVQNINYKYYDKHTIHDSTLSVGLHSSVANHIGLKDEAYKKFKESCQLDLGIDMHSSDEGIHSASLGMLWQNVVHGFLGVKMEKEYLVINPNIPSEWNRAIFNIIWRGQQLNFEVSRDYVRVQNKGLGTISIKLYNQIIELSGSQLKEIEVIK